LNPNPLFGDFIKEIAAVTAEKVVFELFGVFLNLILCVSSS